MTHELTLAAANLDPGLQNGILVIVWIAAVGLGIAAYARSKGRIGPAVMAFVAAGVLGTFIIAPELVMTTLPNLFLDGINWLISTAQ